MFYVLDCDARIHLADLFGSCASSGNNLPHALYLGVVTQNIDSL